MKKQDSGRKENRIYCGPDYNMMGVTEQQDHGADTHIKEENNVGT